MTLISPPFCHFIASADKLSILPPEVGREVAFWGRSNVGKSSVLNALMGRHKLARISKTPGRTQAIHFYQVHPQLRFVDLPGYGYAAVPLAKQQQWDALIGGYFKKRRNLDKIFLLIDSRHGPKAIDRQARDFLEAIRLPYQCLLTKIDKIPQAELDKRLVDIQQNFLSPHGDPHILMISALRKIGIEAVRQVVEQPILSAYHQHSAGGETCILS